MNARPSLFLVDVFAERPFCGNQLAVVVGADPSQWCTERMQAFAREMNFSETTFAAPSPRDGAWDVRIFTPAEEIPFAGHPTLGTAWVLSHLVAGETAPSSLRLRLGIGEVPVDCEDTGLVRMRPRSPELGPPEDDAALAALLGLDAADLDPRHPCRCVRLGIGFALVPLRSLAALRRARVRAFDLPPLRAEGAAPIGVLAFCAEPYDDGGEVAVRMFFEADGVREDPATGSAAACLAAWMSAERYLGDAVVRARLQQGYEIGRPSCLHVAAGPEGDGFAVEVAGRVRLVARGELA